MWLIMYLSVSINGTVMAEQIRSTVESEAGASATEFEALQTIIAALRSLDPEARRRILESSAVFLGVSPTTSRGREGQGVAPASVFGPSSDHVVRTPFSEDTSMSPKEFLMEKAPKTDVERIACLAYYLTHYRATQHFKTLDISHLNTEAAQPKFSNAGYSANNALKMGYLASSTRGHRQLSALGERFVQALPDRNAAKDVLLSLRRRNRAKRKRTSAEAVEEE
jgi:hypothetical protein